MANWHLLILFWSIILSKNELIDLIFLFFTLIFFPTDQNLSILSKDIILCKIELSPTISIIFCLRYGLIKLKNDEWCLFHVFPIVPEPWLFIYNSLGL